jgi:hypothetical protein
MSLHTGTSPSVPSVGLQIMAHPALMHGRRSTAAQQAATLHGTPPVANAQTKSFKLLYAYYAVFSWGLNIF